MWILIRNPSSCYFNAAVRMRRFEELESMYLMEKSSIEKIDRLAEASLKRWWTSAAYKWREKWQKDKDEAGKRRKKEAIYFQTNQIRQLFFLTFFKPLLRLFNVSLCSIQLFSTWYTVALRFGNGFHLLQIFQEKARDHIWLCRSRVFMLPATTRHGGFKKIFGINHGRLLTYVCEASA